MELECPLKIKVFFKSCLSIEHQNNKPMSLTESKFFFITVGLYKRSASGPYPIQSLRYITCE